MTYWKYFLFLTLCLPSSRIASAQGDPYYYSTWHARPGAEMSWTSLSVMPENAYQSSYVLSGSMYPHSPKYFQPGFGYAVPRQPFRSPLRYYNQQYSFGRLTTGSPIEYSVGQSTTGDGSVFGTTGLGQIGGLAPVSTLNRPWYFPGSPGNDTEFQYGW